MTRSRGDGISDTPGSREARWERGYDIPARLGGDEFAILWRGRRPSRLEKYGLHVPLPGAAPESYEAATKRSVRLRAAPRGRAASSR